MEIGVSVSRGKLIFCFKHLAEEHSQTQGSVRMKGLKWSHKRGEKWRATVKEVSRNRGIPNSRNQSLRISSVN